MEGAMRQPLRPMGFLLLAAMSLLASSVHAQTWNQVWSDEFDGTAVNTGNWTFETGGGGWGNNELQTYTTTNTTVSGGVLTITARKDPYTSARLNTSGKRS